MTEWKLMENTITFTDKLKMSKFIMTTDRFTNGVKVKKFESEWSDWLGCKYSLFVSSGSTANLLLVAAIIEKYNLKRGDKVLVPACTWMTNVAPIIQLGLEPIFCDINLDNFSFDENQMLEISKVHPDIKMIFVTHLLGFTANNDKYKEIYPNAIIIDDVCESHGARFKDGSRVGSDSLGATFSFYFGHHMTTIEGGMVSTNDEELYDLMKMKRSHGLARESVDFLEYSKKYPNIDKSFLFITDGYNFRNHEVCAVLGSSQLKKLDNNIKIRRENYQDFWNIIKSHSNILYVPEYQEGNSSFCFPLIARNRVIYNELISKMAENKIEFRPIVGGNLLSQPFLKNYKMAIDSPTRSEYSVELIEKCGVYLGNSQFISNKHLRMIESILQGISR